MKRTIKDLVGLDGKVVLVRVDFNVPMDESGRITDVTRIVNALPTIKYLIGKNAKVVLLSHLGRPKGFEPSKSLWPVALYLMKLLKKLKCGVTFSNQVIGQEVRERIKTMQPGSVLLLENTRFYKEEEANDADFAREIASMGDIFVNDAFGTAHRKNASTYALARFLPNAIGFLMEKELDNLSLAIENPKRPFIAVLGGAKVNTKIKILERFIDKADKLIIGGAMAYTFMYARGEKVGSSLVDEECIGIARDILAKAEAAGKEIILPIDHVAVSASDRRNTPIRVKELKGDLKGYDIGENTIKLFTKEINKAKQIFWNGPMGLFEQEEFSVGSRKIGSAIANAKAYSIVGGGDTVSAVNEFGLAKKINFISTGGGASMEFIENGSLPCVDIIQEKIK